MRAEPSLGRTTAQRRLHWWTAALVLLAFPLGWVMVGVPLSQLLLKFLLYQLHKTLGILAFALAVTRLLVRARRGRPGWYEGIPGWQRQAAGAVHALLYAVLIATPALGYLTAATAPIGIPTLFLGVIPIPHLLAPDPVWFSVLRPLHRSMAILLVVLAGGHAAGHNRTCRGSCGRRIYAMGAGDASSIAPRRNHFFWLRNKSAALPRYHKVGFSRR
jgi:cytochrome b561